MIRNRQGAALALVAVSLVVILGMGALVVDMGMLIKQREDAQRAADAAALAGASAYQNSLALDAVIPAKDRAFDLLARNYVGGTYIDTSGQASTVVGGNRYITTSTEGTVIVLPDSWKVRVIVRRPAVGTLFASVLGYLHVPIAAKAAAEATTSGAGKCLKPFALPDIWADANDDDNSNRLEDIGANPKNPIENWRYDTGDGDHYRALGGSGGGEETGWGSTYRNSYTDEHGSRYLNDYGRQIKLKVTSSHDVPSPSFFQAWAIGDDRGGDAYRWNISHCNLTEVKLSTDVDFDSTLDVETSEPGNMVGPTFQGMQDLIAQDPDACWLEEDDSLHVGYKTGMVGLTRGGSCTPGYPGWESSPRVITVPLFSPSQIQSGRTKLAFNNLGVFFIEGQATKDDPVVARFLFYAKGTGAGPTQGSLTKQIRLVE
jgi:Flp pilus assembly protein TadG